MARASEKDVVTPPRSVETTPTVYPSPNYDFIMQAVWEINRTLGALQTSVDNLNKREQEHGDKLSEIGKKIHTAEVTLGIIGVIAAGAGYLLWHLLTNIWGTLSPLISVSIKH